MRGQFNATRWAREHAAGLYRKAADDREVALRANGSANRAEEKARRLGLWVALWTEVGSEPADHQTVSEDLTCTTCDGDGRFAGEDGGWCNDCDGTGIREPNADDREALTDGDDFMKEVTS
jgi:DnaJ-class molecular chaperone